MKKILLKITLFQQSIFYTMIMLKKNPDKIKAYLVLKTKYSFGKSPSNDERKILVHKVSGYYIEQIDFSNGYKQDHRNWSSDFNGNSGRLQITKNILENNQLEEKNISYFRTKEFLSEVYHNNLK